MVVVGVEFLDSLNMEFTLNIHGGMTWRKILKLDLGDAYKSLN